VRRKSSISKKRGWNAISEVILKCGKSRIYREKVRKVLSGVG